MKNVKSSEEIVHDRAHVQAIAMIAAGELPMEDIISHTFPLKEFRKGIDQVCNFPRL